MSLVNQELVLSNIMNTVTLKLMKHSIKRNKNKEMQKNIVGKGRWQSISSLEEQCDCLPCGIISYKAPLTQDRSTDILSRVSGKQMELTQYNGNPKGRDEAIQSIYEDIC